MQNEVQHQRATQVVAIGNQKGGVGKTSNTVQLATALAEIGNKCLIIDLDAGHGATRHFGIPGDFLGTFEVLAGLEDPLDVVMTNDDDEIELPSNLSIIPARRNLEQIDEALRSKSKFYVPRDVLMEPISKLRGHYDYIFLDTAPSATTPTVAAYWAADWFILSAMPEHFAIEGLVDALQDIEDAQQGGGGLRLLGVIVSGQQARPRISKTLTQYIEDTFGEGQDGRSFKFDTEISRSVIVTDAQSAGKTIFQLAPTHKVTDQYRALAREVQDRIRVWTADELLPQPPPAQEEGAPVSPEQLTPTSETSASGMPSDQGPPASHESQGAVSNG